MLLKPGRMRRGQCGCGDLPAHLPMLEAAWRRCWDAEQMDGALKVSAGSRSHGIPTFHQENIARCAASGGRHRVINSRSRSQPTTWAEHLAARSVPTRPDGRIGVRQIFRHQQDLSEGSPAAGLDQLTGGAYGVEMRPSLGNSVQYASAPTADTTGVG